MTVNCSVNWLKTRNSPRWAGFVDRQLDALERVADVEEAAGLPALAVDRQRVADHRLHAEAVERRAEDLVVVEARAQALVEVGLVGRDAVDDALVEVGRPQAPDAAGEVDVVRVVDLREVVDRARELRVGQRVLAALVLDLDEALLDVDVGRPVLAHRPELDEVAVGHPVAQREQQVQRADHVRLLRVDRVAAGDHRVRRRRLLAVVDDRLGQHVGDDLVEELAVVDVADHRLDVAPRDLPPGLDPLAERGDRGQRVRRVLVVPATAGEVVDDEHLVAPRGEPHGGGPAEVAVATEDQDAHGRQP